MTLRLYLTGTICIEYGESLLEERSFPSRQCRLALAYLALERQRPVPRDELAEVIWGGAIPPAWDAALSAIISKLRGALKTFEQPCGVDTAFGCYQLRLIDGAWVDVDAAANAIHDAEGALRAGDARRAWGPANVAAIIARRSFLPGEDADWIEARRGKLRSILVRALDCLSDVLMANGDSTLAIEASAESIALEPFRETGYQKLMRAQAAAGNRAEALRVYERCRRLLAEELGADPSPQTEALYLQLLSEA